MLNKIWKISQKKIRNFFLQIRYRRKLKNKYNIAMFKNEKVIVRFGAPEECREFLLCCRLNGMGLTCTENKYAYAYYYNDYVLCNFWQLNRNPNMVIRFGGSIHALQRIDPDWKLILCSALLINTKFPSKKDLMKFLEK